MVCKQYLVCFNVSPKETSNYSTAKLLLVWRCVTNGDGLDKHVIREKRKEWENRWGKIEKGRGGDRESKEKEGRLLENWSYS